MSNKQLAFWLSIVIWSVTTLWANAQDHSHPPVVIGPPDGDTTTVKDSIPDFAQNPTITSAKSGPCQEPSTWAEGRQPTQIDIALIREEHTVTGSCNAAVMGVQGIYSLDAGTLRVDTVLVYRPGRFHCSNTGQIIIQDQPINFAKDPQQFGTGIIVFGEFVCHGGLAKTPFVRLAQDARAGDLTLTLESAPTGWRAGDRIFVPDTRQTPVLYTTASVPMRWEEVTVASVVGPIVVLTGPLQFDHLGAFGKQAHAVNLTRSIVIKSANPNGTRGHTFYTERASVSIKNVQFESLGRTTEALLSDAKLVNGVWQIGLNQRGRYPVHFHHLMGPRNVSNVGNQFAFDGNSVLDCRKWCVTVHNSHWGRLPNNVAVYATGAGVVTEQGNERENEFDNWFIGAIGTTITSFYNPIYGGVRLPFTAMDFAFEGSCGWYAGADNYIRNNVHANCAYTGVNLNSRAASGFADHHPVVPKFRGADNAIPSEWDNYGYPLWKEAPPVRVMSGNETYASTEGMWVSFSTRGVVKDTLAWNVRQRGLYAARNFEFTFDGFTALADPAISNQNYAASCGICASSFTYASGLLTFRNLVVKGMNYGIQLPGHTTTTVQAGPPDVILVEGGQLQNNVNVVASSGHRPKQSVIKGFTFARNPYGTKRPVGMPTIPPLDFMGTLEGRQQGSAITPLAQVVVYGYNGQDVEFFFPEQAPNYVMPRLEYPTGVLSPLMNCPTQGLTNAQCMTVHGVATLGRVATCTTVRPEARGFVCPIQ